MFKILRRFTQIDYLKVFVRILVYKHSVITKQKVPEIDIFYRNVRQVNAKFS